MTGPRSEPPMPMLMMLRMRLPVWPFHAPLRTLSEKADILSEHGVHAGNDVFAVDHDRFAFGRAQGDVQDGAVFRDVDLVAAKHRFDVLLQAALFGELEEQLERFIGDAVLRVIEEDADGFGGVARAALRILVEELTQVGL